MTSDPHTLTGAYAADALDAEERARFEQHLEHCASCAQEARELQATAARLGAAASAAPPAALRERVLAEVASVRQLPPVVTPLAARRTARVARVAVAAVAAAAVVLAAVAGVAAVRFRDQARERDAAAAALARVLSAPDARTVRAAGGPWRTANVVVSPSAASAVLVAHGVAAPPDGRTYELWFVGSGGPRAAGTFEPAADGTVTRVLDGRLDGAGAVAVTVEPDGGVPAPTTDPVAVVRLG